MSTEKNTASLGFEQKIWEAADTLRGNLNAAEYEGACQKAELIPSDVERDTRGTEATTEEAKDSTKVTPNITVDDDWEGIIDVGFGFGGEQGNDE